VSGAAGAARNQDLVLRFFEDMNSGEPERQARAVAMLAEDATYWIPGDWKNGGTFGKAQLAAMVQAQTAVFQEPLELTIHGVTAEGDRVAVEMESRGRFRDGRPYHNTYHWLFVFRGAEILRIKEYTDTLYANAAYYG
jgi:ketosteroid isomerase-like protein